MSHGTIYTIYKTIPNQKIDFDKEKVVKNFNFYKLGWFNSDEVKELKYNWRHVPDVISEKLALSNDYEHDRDYDNSDRFYLKENGSELRQIASWGFCSNSIFMFDDIFDFNLPDEIIISDTVVRQFIDAMDLALEYNPKKNGSSSLFIKQFHNNVIFANIVSKHYAPFINTTGFSRSDMSADEERIGSEYVMMEVKAIFEAFCTLKKADEDFQNPAKYILTAQYY